jgi:hypothetical protein
MPRVAEIRRPRYLRACPSACDEYFRAWDGSGNPPRPSGGRGRARLRYDFKIECREQGWGDPAFVYDEEKDLFRWTDGRFAFSREHADWKLLR